MDKVGIATWFGTENYGSNLQAYGLSFAIRSFGYEVCFVERFQVLGFMLRHPVMLFARGMFRVIEKRRRAFFAPTPYSISSVRKERLRAFREDHFTSRVFRDEEDWRKTVSDGMIFAAGSDIIWNPARGYPGTFFLDFAYYARMPRFSYASSIGAKELPAKYARAYRKYLGSMISLGVREQAAADLLEPLIGKKATRVVDPSILLSASDWDVLAEKARLSVEADSSGYVLCYFVMNDSRYWEYVKRIKEETGLQVIVLPMHEMDEQQPYDIVLDGTPYEFVWLVKHAECICTDSFHACVLSMIYEKEFYLLRRSRKAEDAKYDDFLGRYHLEDRSVRDESVFGRKPVDYSFAREQLEKDREFSWNFLKDALDRSTAALKEKAGKSGRGAG